LPSATETVTGLGLTSSLVGRSHECDGSPEVTALPVVTAPRFRTDRPSAAIDRDIRALVEQGLAVYRVDAERLRTLRPDVILTQDQCDVCSVSAATLSQAVDDWVEGRPRLVTLHGATLAAVMDDMQVVADALGEPGRGTALIRRLRERIEAIAARAEALPRRPTVAAVEWIEPLMGAGNWMPELIAQAGGQAFFGEAGAPSPWLAWDDLRRADLLDRAIAGRHAGAGRPAGMGRDRGRRPGPGLSR
jgi:iron complex transport system substrate-binding protein